MDEPTKYTLNALAVEFGVKPITMKKKLTGLAPKEMAGGAFKYYYIKDVLDYLLKEEMGYVSPAQESAKLNEQRRLKLELERSILEGKHVEIEKVREMMVEPVMKTKAKLISIKGKLSPQIPAIIDIAEAEKVVGEVIDECLNELASGELFESMDTTATVDGE